MKLETMTVSSCPSLGLELMKFVRLLPAILPASN